MKDGRGIKMKELKVKDLKKILENIDDDVAIVCASEDDWGKDFYMPQAIYQDKERLYIDSYLEQNCFDCKERHSCNKKSECCGCGCENFNDERNILFNDD